MIQPVLTIDIMGSVPESKQGTHTYILVMTNFFSKWIEVFAIPDQQAPTVAQKLIDEAFVDWKCQNNYTMIKASNLRTHLLKNSAKF